MPAKKNRRAAQDVSRAFNPLPKFFAPMMAQRADQLPEGAEWAYELKLDGSPDTATVILLVQSSGEPIAVQHLIEVFPRAIVEMSRVRIFSFVAASINARSRLGFHTRN